MLKENDKIGIVACSNALPIQAKSSIHELEKILKRHQLEPVFSQYIYQTKDLYSGTGWLYYSTDAGKQADLRPVGNG